VETVETAIVADSRSEREVKSAPIPAKRRQSIELSACCLVKPQPQEHPCLAAGLIGVPAIHKFFHSCGFRATPKNHKDEEEAVSLIFISREFA
jgi:hypothetical protein